MAIKLIALDLDGTLLTTQKTIDEETKKRLIKAQEMGISSQQHRKDHVLPDAGCYALQRAGGRERNLVCLLPCHSYCRCPVPQPHDGQAFSE